MEIGNVIKKYRLRKNYTQEELAQLLKVTPQAISRWETGLSYPDIAMVPEIVRALEVSANELFGVALSEEKVNPEYALLPVNLLQKMRLSEEEPLSQDQVDTIFADETPAKTGAKRVLIVDDAPFLRNIVTDILSKEGHTVYQAENGKEGIKMISGQAEKDWKIDVCLLDINMPEMDGLNALKALRKTNPELRIVMLSISSTRENVEKAKTLGADAFIAKPFQAQRLIEKI